MIAEFSTDELVYNQLLKGAMIYHDNVKKVINYVKTVKDTRQLQFHCTDGSIFLGMQDQMFNWEVNKKLDLKKVNLKRLTGK